MDLPIVTFLKEMSPMNDATTMRRVESQPPYTLGEEG
jgi:hypothetical protein